MNECLLSEMKNNIGKKKPNEVEKSNIILDNNQIFEGEMPGYLDDILQHSKKTVFIIRNQNNNNNSPKKRIIKKKKVIKENNIKYIKSENEEKNEIDSKGKKKQKIIKKTNKKINYTYNVIKESDKDKIKEQIIHNLEVSVEETFENSEEKENNNYNKLKSNMKDDVEMYEIKLEFINLYKNIFLHKLMQSLKSIFILIKMKNSFKSTAKKLSNIYHCHLFRNKLKFNIIMSKILEIRKEKAQKISSIIKAYLIRKETIKLLQKAENNYIIYSSLNIDKSDILYFKYIHKNGKEENFYFEYSPLLKCFIFFINKNNDKYFKIIQGNFYNSKSKNKLIDKNYEINNKGENVINLPKIFKKVDTLSERYDRIINRYIKLHRPVKRTTVDEFEESKKKAHDDSNLKNNNSKSQKLTKLGDTSRSKSFMRIKGEPKRKSILKPSRSYVNLKCGEKKIQFGKAKIRKYKNKKD